MSIWKKIQVAFAIAFARYDATQISSTRSWRSTPYQDGRLDLTKASREVLQSKSRDWERNSPLYTKLADTWEQYTVGTGIQISSASSDSVWNIEADAVWERWKPIADIQSRFGFDNLQGIIARANFVDGEIFVVLTSEGAYPRIQIIEAHRCKTPESLQSSEGKSIIDGVRIDSVGRPISYYFQTNDGGYSEVEASFVVHVFEPGRAGEYRGKPYCTAALNVVHDLDDLRALEMRAAKDAAELSTFYKTKDGELPPSLVSMAQKFRGVSTASGTSSSGVDNRREYYQNATGGRNIVLQAGDDVQQHIPERPGANTREYWRLLAGDVCACAGIPLSIVYPDSMQGTVYRGSLDAFAAFCRAKTAVYAGYLKRIRNYVIQSEARFNKTLARMPEDWRKTSNGTVRAPNVDIGRNSRAILDEVAGGLRCFSSVAAELGLDGREILKQKADEARYIRQLAQDRQIDPSEISTIVVDRPERISTEPQKPENAEDYE